MVEVKFAGVNIPYILHSISKNKDRNYNINTFIGSTGGNSVEYLSTNGTVLSFSSIVSKDDRSILSSYRNLAKTYKEKAGVLVASEDLEVNGNYYLTDFKEEKKLNGSYIINWEFTEYVKPSIVKATFKRIGKSATKKTTTTKAKKTTAKKTSSYITILLTDCSTLKYGMVNKKCVKYLQKFLQKKGYYEGYKIDGDYLKYTKQEVNKLQKAYKIKVSKSNQGQWDKTTRDYWRKKYNITSKKKKK